MCVSIQILPASWRAHRTKVERLRRTADRNQGGMHLHWWHEQGRAVCRQILPMKTHMTGFSSASIISGCYEHSPKNRLLEQQSHELPDKTVMVFGLWVAQMGTPMNIHELPSDNWQIWGMCSIGSSRRRRHGCCTAMMAIRKVTGAMWCENQHPYVAAWWNYCKRFKEREEIYETNRKLVQDTGITWMTMIFSRLFVSIRSACSVVSPNALAMAVWASGADTAFSFKGWAHGHWHTWNCYII